MYRIERNKTLLYVYRRKIGTIGHTLADKQTNIDIHIANTYKHTHTDISKQSIKQTLIVFVYRFLDVLLTMLLVFTFIIATVLELYSESFRLRGTGSPSTLITYTHLPFYIQVSTCYCCYYRYFRPTFNSLTRRQYFALHSQFTYQTKADLNFPIQTLRIFSKDTGMRFGVDKYVFTNYEQKSGYRSWCHKITTQHHSMSASVARDTNNLSESVGEFKEKMKKMYWMANSCNKPEILKVKPAGFGWRTGNWNEKHKR